MMDYEPDYTPGLSGVSMRSSGTLGTPIPPEKPDSVINGESVVPPYRLDPKGLNSAEPCLIFLNEKYPAREYDW